jgi:hypothetical protein
MKTKSAKKTSNVPILNPLAAKIPETLDRTPGSFWTRQLNVCLSCPGRDTGVGEDVDEVRRWCHEEEGGDEEVGGGDTEPANKKET